MLRLPVEGRGHQSLRLDGAVIIIRVNVVLEKAEDVVENIVALRLLSQKEGLRKFARGLRVVGHLSQDRHKDAVVCRRLRINV